jgi:MoxR-like ATPase
MTIATPASRYVFHNEPKRRPANAHVDAPPADKPELYVASDELKEAVNLAIYLERPLLLEGEAGCGKTRLARAVAHELGLPFYTWYVRSTSKAQEGLYEYDAILRLHDLQTQRRPDGDSQKEVSAVSVGRDPGQPADYRRFGPLGEAFKVQDRRAVVLIDEIDKADLDFPNDLLSVLDEPREFKIHETGESIRARHTPIVIITSNKEKGNLPKPFLRRCIYHYVEFPNPELLRQIVDVHYPAYSQDAPELAAMATERFAMIRQEALYKKPGTSEFLDWLKALHDLKKPDDARKALSSAEGLPFRGLLLKLQPDWQRYGAAS